MKKLFFAYKTYIVISLTICMSSFSEKKSRTATFDLSDHLFLFYDINEGKGSIITDYSGNDHHGLLEGTPGSAWTLGTGSDSTVSVNRALDIGNTQRSIRLRKMNNYFNQASLSLWVKPLYFDTHSLEREQTMISSTTTGGPNLTINNQGKVIFRISGGGDSEIFTSNVSIGQVNQWHHVCLTYNKDNGFVNLTIDGKSAISEICSNPIPLKIDSFCIIGYSKGKDSFDGIIDNFIIYNEVLDSADIKFLSDGNLPSKKIPKFTVKEKELKDVWSAPVYNVSVREPDFPPNPIDKDGWALVKNDEFEGTRLDETLWIPYYFRHRVSDDKYAQADYVIKNGLLILEINKDKPYYGGGTDGMKVSSIQTLDKTNLHKPGERSIETTNKFTQKYGYFEIRAKTQIGLGNLCAFWLVGSQDTEMQNGEIDVFEQPGNAGSNALLFNLYQWNDSSLGEPVVNGGWKNRLRFQRPLALTFNIYGLEWNESQIKLYFNNKLVNIIPKSPSYDMGVLLSLYESDSDWFGKLDKNVPSPKQFIIDYLRIYKKK